MSNLYSTHLSSRKTQEIQAVELLVALNTLANRQVLVTFLGERMTLDVVALIALHDKYGVALADTLAFAKALVDCGLENTSLDIVQAIKAQKSANEFDSGSQIKATDVVLYGFGRIGRILARLLMSRPASESGLQLKAIVVRPAGEGDLAKRASLLERDSVHGWFNGSVQVDTTNNGIIVNGRFIKVIYASDPSEVDYTAHDINDAIVIDNTGKWKDEAGLGKHLTSKGVKKVLLTAPAKGEIKNIVYGVNHDTIGGDTIVSAASCTTNAITPTLKVLHDEYGIVYGHMETIHAFTNDQNLVDNHHKADRRGRAAPLNMVMTSTGAASAVSKAIPELKGKLSGNAIRVPTPNVSLAILNLNFEKTVGDAKAINAFIQSKVQSEQWQAQIDYSDSPEAVSTDFVGSEKVAIFDAKATIATDNRATLYVWYDNEMGYSTQVIRVAEEMAK
ncbi:glyceraldehyde-3-phosphate dehydrogenase [Moraxella catarrhalis]|uniref:NADPH-dependent glyceraldehyde-3-phosphate dehydrogenase n=1 Tax=Moraxella catarrhalis TaxID=480 RepID=A0AB36DP10_MORCA|nr:glyceraldehyde-3-phosphate dehydrogenase [Moraxella catarrhalis]MPX28898.1 aldehyde dehydrogenase [Moraxella catarrhalis]OAV25105.1 NADPH-dependent glyceraldehyde-3-phosphate dehydrogenase [Moraxella catarrhalis]RKL88542.1 glyceraldehyde-3-phosphate dehydrogenase [Moraxella catarrhalis]RKL89422.1 glyceraldehyde-3-phosphate dehydrogenase [Moraxella catarrhalis]RKL97618.1 glyceraldehyde-3-phosphate dehydrogenase [Moraxella catarrhalis]